MRRIIIALIVIFMATNLSAHSRIGKTSPANGAVLTSVPPEISFDFAKKIRMTKVTMTHLDHPSVDLELGTQKAFSKSFTLPVIKMGAGTYNIEWRGLGLDGHAVKGNFNFTVE